MVSRPVAGAGRVARSTRRLIAGISHQPGQFDGLHRAAFVVVRGVAADADGTDYHALGIADQHPPGHRNHFAGGQAVDRVEKRRHRLRPPGQLTPSKAHAQAATGFTVGDLRTQEARLFVAQDRQWMSGGIQDHGGQGFDSAFPGDADRVAGDLDGDFRDFANAASTTAAALVTLGGAALDQQRQRPADLVILDIGLPDISGFETCRQLRRFTEVPVMFLSARDGEIDRVVGLEIGADDYVVKPFSPREVAARVKAILKRVAPREMPAASAPGVFQIDDAAFRIHYHGQALSLTRHEFRLLRTLLGQPRRVYSREQLLDALGVASEAGYERNIDSHIKSLRSKLRSVAAQAEPIQTHRGLGYSYSPSHS